MRKYCIFCFMLLFPVCAQCAPVITQISGSTTDGGIISISGSYFGKAPNVIIFDDFEKGAMGENVPLNSPNIGAWTKYGGTPPTVVATAHSGKKSMEIYVATDIKADQTFKQIQKVFDNPINEIYFSYWVRIPEGTNFPTAIEPRQYADQSAWKFIWLYDGEQGYKGDDDYILPTAVGSKFYLTGNDGYIYTSLPKSQATEFRISQGWWTFDGWMRISGWFYIDPDDRDPAPAADDNSDSVYDSKIRVEFLTEGIGSIVDSSDHVRIGDGDDEVIDNNVSQWTQINFPGWMRYGNENINAWIPNCRPVYDDIYIATGENAQARIEMGDNQTYSLCHNLTILSPLKWSANSIEARVNQGSFKDGQKAYIFVIDSDGNASVGSPVSVNKNITAPKAPGGLKMR